MQKHTDTYGFIIWKEANIIIWEKCENNVVISDFEAEILLRLNVRNLSLYE